MCHVTSFLAELIIQNHFHFEVREHAAFRMQNA